MMFCSNCGEKLSDEAVFCPKCGFKVAKKQTNDQAVSGGKKRKKGDLFLLKYFGFKGRINRKPYIIRSVIASIVSLDFAVVANELLEFRVADMSSAFWLFFISVFCFCVSAWCFLIMLSATIRRLHDLNHSGFWCLSAFVPIINLCLAIYLIFWKGTEGDNQYGPDPLGG